MKTKIKLILASLLVGLSLFAINSQPAHAADEWGARKVFTTPKATRGTWYYKEHKKIKKLVVKAHTLDTYKLYKPLTGKKAVKEADKIFDIKSTKKRMRDFKEINATLREATLFTAHGYKGFMATGWLADGGVYYVSMKKMRHGRKVKVLRIGTGAKDWEDFYAYKSKKLAK
ncbi:hypothetical protein [Lactobacillus xujianguonis]|uniref:hypothetical protein n=1 Tax=Lactobacillus xujianguonis TaxID=2495899 RepID=UPI000FD7C460|nr:hypothetical protein [Lactobacillus xujianguonis]RVU73335.1 hypothetical protein EJK20_08780 [Lactobacillus xujianguonis]